MDFSSGEIERLEAKALDVRRDIITLLANAGTGHSGGSLSSADYATALLFHEANIQPGNPSWKDRDYWHFSIGHVTPLIYSVMAEAGYFPLKDLLHFRTFDGHLQGHPSAKDTPGIEVSAGSLGQGLSICVGAALASQLDRHPRRIYCIIGDGELQEGSIWEAAMSASHYRLGNLCGFVDVNRKQIDGDTADVLAIEPLAEKWNAFGWNVIEINGHSMNEILQAFIEAKKVTEKPSVILGQTVMGKGVSFMEDDHLWHGRPPSIDQAEQALSELGTDYTTWKNRIETNGAGQ